MSSIYIDITAKLARQDLVIQKLFQLSDIIRCRYLQSSKKWKKEKKKKALKAEERQRLINHASKEAWPHISL